VPAYPTGGYGPRWKGALLGRPAAGAGSLAGQWTRLGARILDSIVLLPVTVTVFILAFVVAHPHLGTLSTNPDGSLNGSPFPPGFLRFEATILGAEFVCLILTYLYDALATAHYGRTLGKAWLHIRPLRVDGSPLSTGRAFGRGAVYFGGSIVSIFSLLNVLWCLWDPNRQCLHDKLVETIVVNDR
jgi:uncharacterized RDD family membrane protein YckC